MKTIQTLKNKFVGRSGTASGILGGIGSVHNVCHSLCVTVVSLLAVFGITTSILPLMFLQTYQRYFWWAAFGFTAASLYFYLQQHPRRGKDRDLLFINAGLLLFGLPFPPLRDYLDFFRFAGGALVVAGVFLLLFGKKIHAVVGSAVPPPSDALSQSLPVPTWPHALMVVPRPRLTATSLLWVIVAGSFLTNQYLMYRVGIFSGKDSPGSRSAVMPTLSRMKFTPFDVALAKERMDKNNDGRCDTCGMDIEQCIDSGQLDCNMGNNPNAIGLLGSQHIHADFKIYVNGTLVDFSDKDHMGRIRSNLPVSSFIHVDSGVPLPEKTGDLLHMHATNVPLGLFFRSIGLKLDQENLTLTDGRVLKNGNGETLKFYLNGRRVDQLHEYVFFDVDKILVSYGPENDPDIEQQLRSVTDFAQNH